MKNHEFVKKALEIANNADTVYMMGTFGASLTESLILQKAKQYPRYYSAGRQTYLKNIAANAPWAFDCVGLIKGILWGWIADRSRSFGGAVYRSNSVPDISANTMAKQCLERNTAMENILPGEAVYMDGHIGIYIGDGKVVESTLTGKYDGVVITGLNERKWTGHGKLPWITYEDGSVSPAEPEETVVSPPAVGETVNFSGGKHYTSSTGNTGYNAKPGPAKVTRYIAGRKHPYHLIHTDKTSNVYGWVDADTVSK